MKNLSVLFALLLTFGIIRGQTLKTSVFSSGGGHTQSAGYSHFGSFAQPLSTGTTGTNYINREGFIFAQQNIVEATISSDETICYNTSPQLLNSAVTGAEGTVTYQWQHWDGLQWQNIIGATSGAYDPGDLTETTQYRLLVDDKSGIGQVVSDTVTITVWESFASGTILTTGETICQNGDPVLIGSNTDAAGGDETITYAWYESTNDFTDSSLIIGAAASTYDPPSGLTETTNYRRYAHDGTCNTAFEQSTGTWKVNVYDEFDPGEIQSPGETICFEGDPTAIGSSSDATGGDELITYKWEFSTDDFNTAGLEIIGAASSTYDPPSGLTETTSYRRYAHDGTCNTTFEASTGTWKVTVRNEFTSGTIETTGESIIYNEDPSEIGGLQVASGGDGNIMYQWQSSTDESFSSPSSINSNTASYDPPPNLTVTTWYRRQAKDGTCSSAFTSSTGVWKVEVFAPRVVNSNQGTQFYYIQDAIDAANPGDHIIATEPTGEHLYINKELTIEYDYSGHED